MVKNDAQTVNKNQPGKRASEEKDRVKQPNRNDGSALKKPGRFRHNERNFDLLVDGVPYTVKSIPFSFNEELVDARYSGTPSIIDLVEEVSKLFDSLCWNVSEGV